MRVRKVTRTIVSTDVEVMTVNTVTKEFGSVVVTVAGTYNMDDEKDAKALEKTVKKSFSNMKLGDAVGLPFTPNTCFVDLVVNGKYLGTYTAMDYVEADREDGTSKRVNADEKTGWLIEMMNESGVDTSGDVYVAGTNYTRPWVVIKNPEPDYKKTDTEEVKNAAISAVTNPVQTFINNLWTSPETYVDKTTLVNWYIASEILGGTTTLSSVYAYKDAEDTQKTLL